MVNNRVSFNFWIFVRFGDKKKEEPENSDDESWLAARGLPRRTLTLLSKCFTCLFNQCMSIILGSSSFFSFSPKRILLAIRHFNHAMTFKMLSQPDTTQKLNSSLTHQISVGLMTNTNTLSYHYSNSFIFVRVTLVCVRPSLALR